MIRTKTYKHRPGFTLAEVTLALALIVIVGAIVAQAIVWSLRERSRLAMHHAANEIAANVLEDARALPFDQLDQKWAEAQAIPSESSALLPQGKLTVTVESLKGTQAKRITAEVRWQLEPDTPPRRVTLTSVLSGRANAKKGGTP